MPEGLAEKRSEELELLRTLNSNLDGASDSTQERYHKLLFAERKKQFDPKRPGSVDISTKRRLEIFEMASSGQDITQIIDDARTEFSRKTTTKQLGEHKLPFSSGGGTFASHVADALEERER